MSPEVNPIRAIREKCLECVGGECGEVRNCTATPDKCRLWPWRMGEGKPDTAREHNPPSRLQAIKRECCLCMGGYARYVADCPSVDCALHPFRMGRWPQGSAKRTSKSPSWLESAEPETATESECQFQKASETMFTPETNLGPQ